MPLCIDVIAPVFTRIVNLFLSSGIFPKEFKCAVVKPLLKKSTVDSTNLKITVQFRISFLSKLVERIIANCLLTHLSSRDLFAKFQSAYRKFHSSETALLDILVALEAGHSTALLLLDLSAAFNIIYHNILIHRLQHWFGISSTALNLLFSLLSDRYQTVIACYCKSKPVLLE